MPLSLTRKVAKAADIPFQKSEHDFTLIIFGASGSLAKLKLFPSLYQLHLEKRTPKDFKIVGYARTAISQEAFREEFKQAVRAKFKSNTDEKILDAVAKNVSYIAGQYDSHADYTELKKHLDKIENGNKKRIRLAYLSTPPSVFEEVINGLGDAKLDTPLSKLRLIVEKPFGYDLSSAKHLEEVLTKKFRRSSTSCSITISAKRPSLISSLYATRTRFLPHLSEDSTSKISRSMVSRVSGPRGDRATSIVSDRYATWCSHISSRSSPSSRWISRKRSPVTPFIERSVTSSSPSP
jgi:hypothetical protein